MAPRYSCEVSRVSTGCSENRRLSGSDELWFKSCPKSEVCLKKVVNKAVDVTSPSLISVILLMMVIGLYYLQHDDPLPWITHGQAPIGTSSRCGRALVLPGSRFI